MKMLIKSIIIVILIIVIIVIFLIFMFNVIFFTYDKDDTSIPSFNNNNNIDTTLDYKNLGSLSAKHESNGNPATIANNEGDIGGKSYGAYQFAVDVGGMTNFLIFLKKYDIRLYNRLVDARKKDSGYGETFDDTWRQIAAEDKKYFLKVQHECIKNNYYMVVIQDFKNVGFDWTKRSKTIQNVLWSIAVQHGTGGAFTLISTQNYKKLERQKLETDAIFIRGVYKERRKVNTYFSASSQNIKESVRRRFFKEEQEALNMLEREIKENN